MRIDFGFIPTVLHVLGARDGTVRKRIIDIGYVIISIGFYLWCVR